MSDDIKKGKAWVWGVVGAVAGLFLGSIAGPLGAAIGFIVIGVIAFRSSKKNNGAPPAWLWRSKKKDTVK